MKANLLALALVAACPVSAPAAEPSPPNIVLIVSDDHGWTDYGFMGHPRVATPAIDRLAREGLAFRRGYVPSSLCCPSLASLVTGLYPHQHKITCNDPPIPAGMAQKNYHASDAFRQGRERMNAHLAAVPTLPKLLVQRGYVALQTGKWWQGSYTNGGFTHGMTRGGRHGDEGLDIGRKTLQPVFDFIAEAAQRKKPFFVWYAPMMPHQPHTPPPALFEKYSKLTPSPHVARYWAMVEWFDQTCGTLLAHLDEQGISSNTVVAYVADNGWIQSAEKAASERSKLSPYDAGLRTPILLRCPGRLRPSMSDVPVSSIDLLPTLLRLAGIDVPASCPGIDLADEAKLKARGAVFGEVFTHNFNDLDRPEANLRWRWILRDGMKLLAPTALERDASVELYDVIGDPAETRNLAAQKPERVKALTAELDAWWTPPAGR